MYDTREAIIKRLEDIENEKTNLLSLLNDFDIKQNTNICLKSISNDNNLEFTHKLMFDGGSRGNPGLCGAGYVIYKDNVVIKKYGKVVSEKNTNNYAEYMALVLGLDEAIKLGIKNILIQGDSKLVINHLQGNYKCKSDNLIKLYNNSKEILKKFTNYKLEHILRNKNTVADKLANIAMDNYKV